jgi:hypothetical protein
MEPDEPVAPEDPDEPIEPPAPDVVSLGLVEPVLDGELAPVPLDEPAPVPLDVSLEPDDPVPEADGFELDDEDGLEVDDEDDGVDADELELWSLDDPEPLEDAPEELMSIIFAVSPENEARTCAPSFRSERLACEPSFVICVLWSTLSCLSLPESESVLLCLSNFWTLPWIVSLWPDADDELLGSLDADAEEPVPIEPDDPELDGDEALVSDEPELDEPDPMLPEEPEPPIEPWLESVLVLGELELPLVLLPLVWARACAATSAMAAARPRPHPVFFMCLPPSCVWRAGRRHRPASRPLAP